MDILALALVVFAVSKYALDFLAWICIEDTDSLYRGRLDSLWDKLQETTVLNTARGLMGRMVSKLALDKIDPINLLKLLILVLAINYITTILFLSMLAKEHPDFAFFGSSDSLPAVALALISEGGLFPTQQMAWIWLGNSFVAVSGYLLSKILLTRLAAQTSRRTAFFVLASQALLALSIVLCSWLFVRLSVSLYDWGSNTETQQYLVSQTYEVITHPDHFHRILLFLVAATVFSPCTLFLAIFLALFFASFAGDRAKRIILRLIFLVSTDRKPILSQISTLLGSITALTAAVAKYVGSQ